MKCVECERETDVLAAVYTRRWPDQAEDDLRAHVASCAICADVVTVAEAFEDDAVDLPRDVRLPESGAVWWRAQLRAREDAARTAVRPITVAQAIAFACIVGVAGALFGATSAWFQAGLGRLSRWMALIDLRWIALPSPVTTLVAEHTSLVIVIAACLLIAPVAVYLAMGED